MTKLVRWLRAVAHWLRRVPVAPHYWYAVVVVMASLAVMWMCGWTEKAFRITGMVLQLIGVLATVWGIWRTRSDFAQPSVCSQFSSWLRTFPRWNPPPIELSVKPIEVGLFGEAHAISTSGPSVDQTVEGRLAHLENIVKKMEVEQAKTHIAVIEAERKAQHAIDAQALALGGQIDEVSKKVETTATSGVHVAAFGVILLFFGTIFGGAAPELHCLLTP